MTVEQWVNNPSGNRVGGLEREAYKTTMTNRLDPVLVRENNDIKYECYKGEKSTYWLHIKVPSEIVKGFTYDVVFKFTISKDQIHAKGNNLEKDYNMQVFSNDPAFNYTHAYVYNKHKLIPNELLVKCNKVALKTRPTDTNLNEIVTYCKSIYWGILIAKQKGLFAKERYIRPINMKDFLFTITDTDIVLREREEAEKDQKAQKKEAKQKAIKQALRVRDRKSGYIDFSKEKSVNFDIEGYKGPKNNTSANLKAPKFKKM